MNERNKKLIKKYLPDEYIKLKPTPKFVAGDVVCWHAPDLTVETGVIVSKNTVWPTYWNVLPNSQPTKTILVEENDLKKMPI